VSVATQAVRRNDPGSSTDRSRQFDGSIQAVPRNDRSRVTPTSKPRRTGHLDAWQPDLSKNPNQLRESHASIHDSCSSAVCRRVPIARATAHAAGPRRRRPAHGFWPGRQSLLGDSRRGHGVRVGPARHEPPEPRHDHSGADASRARAHQARAGKRRDVARERREVHRVPHARRRLPGDEPGVSRVLPQNPPARSTVVVAALVVPNALVEIECQAAMPK
jgi:hypothetical protein